METVSVRSSHPELLAQICRSLDDKKAEDLQVLRVANQSSITDYLVVATGTSDPHLRALRVELEKVIDASKNKIVGMDTGMESGWLVIDVFDIMVHVLTKENRSRYALERLWKDAESLSVAKILNPNYVEPKPVSAAPAPVAAKVKPARKTKPATAVKKKPTKKAAVSPKAKKPAKKSTPLKKSPARTKSKAKKPSAKNTKKK